MVLGLAGKSGCGKNLLAQWLEHRGYYHFDLDLWGHKGLIHCQKDILARFGSDLLEQDGSLNRSLLAHRVFSDRKKREELQGIIYPWLENEIAQQLKTKEKAILNGALLSQSNLQYRCHSIIWLNTPLWIRLKRLRKRDSRSIWDLIKRIRSQKFLKPQLFSPDVDIHIVQNTKDPESLYRKMEFLLKNLEKKG